MGEVKERKPKTITAWVTKYALTSGIQKVTAEYGSGDNMISVKSAHGWGVEFFHGLDWHHDEASALDRSETMRMKKISSLRKQLAKLEAMTFVASE